MPNEQQWVLESWRTSHKPRHVCAGATAYCMHARINDACMLVAVSSVFEDGAGPKVRIDGVCKVVDWKNEQVRKLSARAESCADSLGLIALETCCPTQSTVKSLLLRIPCRLQHNLLR